MSRAIASLLVAIGADTSGLDSGTRRAGNSLDGLASRAAETGKKLALLGAAAAAAGAAMALKLTRDGLEAIDAQAKLARSIDGTIDGLRGLQIAAGDAGIDDVSKSMQQLNSRLGEAARNGGPAKEMLDRLGLSAQNLMTLDVDQRMAAIADRVKELGLNSAQTADLLRQFGIRNSQMVDFLRQGGDAIRAARQEVDDFGLSISEVDAAQIEAANDAMQRIGRVVESVRNQFAIALAPVLKEIADRFNNLARENKGFGEQAAKAIETGIIWMGKFLDVIQGVRVAFKALELIAVGVQAAFVSSFQASMEAVALFTDGVRSGINFAIEGLNRLPKVDIATLDPFTESAFMRGLRGMGEDARNQVGAVRSELHELAMQELPSAKAEQFLAAVRDRAREAAEATIAARDNSGAYASEFGESGGGSSGSAATDRESRDAERLAREEERYRESLAARLLSLQEFLMSDEEMATHRHEIRLEQLQEALDAELLTEQDAMALREELEQRHMDTLGEIRKRGLTALEQFTAMSYRTQAKTIASELANMTAGVASESRKMFELNKIAGIANAIISAHEGIALTMSKYPYPLNVGMAAAHAAAAFAQVNAIKSASFRSSGGVAPSIAGSTPAPPTSPTGSGTPGRDGTLMIQGISPDALFSGSMVRQLMEQVQEWQRDGGKVVFG